MQRRIAQLEAEKIKLLDALSLARRTREGGRLVRRSFSEGGRSGEGEHPDESLEDHLAAVVNKDLADARERLLYYEAQDGKRN